MADSEPTGQLLIRSQEGSRATYFLFTLQAGDRGGAQVGGGVYVCADGGSEAAAEVGGAADLFLSAVRGVAGHGDAAGGRAQPGGVGHDPRHCQRGAFAELRGVGEFAGRTGAAGDGRGFGVEGGFAGRGKLGQPCLLRSATARSAT